MKIIDKSITRLFTFGCSFTNYGWTTWPEYVSADLDVPYWNYGKSGAGNQYIANMITQADNIHKFNQNDLIMVSWTNVCREDRWINGEWIVPGNIFSQNEYDEKFIKKYVDPLGYLLRDLATIALVSGFLKSKSCQYHFFSMCDLIEQVDQGETRHVDVENHQYQNIIENYKNTIDEIKPSFYRVLWNNDIYHNKFVIENKLFNNKFSDGHPNPMEHLNYIEKLFPGHKFNESTKLAALKAYKRWVKFIASVSASSKKPVAVYNLSQENQFALKELTSIKKSRSNILI